MRKRKNGSSCVERRTTKSWELDDVVLKGYTAVQEYCIFSGSFPVCNIKVIHLSYIQ